MVLDLLETHRPLTNVEREEVKNLSHKLGKVPCLAEGPQAYICTREKDHSGLHVAQGAAGTAFEVFTDEEVMHVS